MRSFGRGIAVLVCVVSLGLAAVAFAGKLGSNPANSPQLLAEPIEEMSYDSARRCTGGATKGAKALEEWVSDHTGGEPWGIYRCEKWGKNSASVHAEGRAIDYRLDAGIAKERRAAMQLIQLLLEADRNGEPFALARRMGVQGLIFNCKSWYGGDLGKYSACYKENGKRDPDVDRNGDSDTDSDEHAHRHDNGNADRDRHADRDRDRGRVHAVRSADQPAHRHRAAVRCKGGRPAISRPLRRQPRRHHRRPRRARGRGGADVPG